MSASRRICSATDARSQGEELSSGPRRPTPNEVPPLDVMMVWHTCMLNPRIYYEDCIRKLPTLLRVGSFPLMQLAGTTDRETLLPHPPVESRAAAFSSFTSQPFDPPMNTTAEDTAVIFCPTCSQPSTVPWITFKADGYAQRDFAYVCHSRQFVFSRETLGVTKFFEDMEKCIFNPNNYFMANTLVDYQSGVPVDRKWSKALSKLILNSYRGDLKPAPPENRGKQIGWTMKSVEGYCRAGFMFGPNKPTDSTPRAPHLIDLRKAYCSDIGHRPGMAYPSATFRKLKDIIGIVPDHDDKVSQETLSDAYDKTAEAWKSLEVAQDSNRSFWPLSKKGKSKALTDTPFENARPDLISASDEAAQQNASFRT
ncbi:hypothetical protein FRB90_000507 [Tulasnella sp. 427]|nr:hypothetical protein FRB90_000507 [Tulasnella sp. 427]